MPVMANISMGIEAKTASKTKPHSHGLIYKRMTDRQQTGDFETWQAHHNKDTEEYGKGIIQLAEIHLSTIFIVLALSTLDCIWSQDL